MWCFCKSGLKLLLVLQVLAVIYAFYAKNGSLKFWSESESPSMINELGEKLVQKSTAFNNQLASINPVDISVESVLHPYMTHENEIIGLSEGIKKYYQSSNDAVVQASKKFGEKYSEFQKSQYLREDVYQVLKKLQQNAQDALNEAIVLSEEEAQFLNEKISEFEQSGLGSPQNRVAKFLEGFPWIL